LFCLSLVYHSRRTARPTISFYFNNYRGCCFCCRCCCCCCRHRIVVVVAKSAKQLLSDLQRAHRQTERESERERESVRATHTDTNTNAVAASNVQAYWHTFHVKRSSRRSVTLRAFQFVSLSPLSARNSSHYNKAAAATTKTHTHI